jgi:hypothetical protein
MTVNKKRVLTLILLLWGAVASVQAAPKGEFFSGLI